MVSLNNVDNKCRICPRICGVNRDIYSGFCGEKNTVRIAFSGIHRWEEPLIAGKGGSGAIFFCGCNLRCVYCQNYEISSGGKGYEISLEGLSDELVRLQNEGADNIDLVTATHFAHLLPKVISDARNKGLTLPVVYNCGGYESVEALRMLEDYVDIYMPDFKYADNALALKLSGAGDYAEKALDALAEMKRQKPDVVENGIMKQGVLVRHLILPGRLNNSRKVLSLLRDNFGEKTYISLMSQYFPPRTFEDSLLNRRLTKLEKSRIEDFFFSLGFENGFVQELSSADEKYVPVWESK